MGKELALGLKALLIGWYVTWREHQYDRAKARYRKAANRAVRFIEEHPDRFPDRM